MTDKKSVFKASPFATIERSGSVSVKLNEFLGTEAGKSQLKQMKSVREVAERVAAQSTSSGSGKK
jgi:hypothetical protein